MRCFFLFLQNLLFKKSEDPKWFSSCWGRFPTKLIIIFNHWHLALRAGISYLGQGGWLVYGFASVLYTATLPCPSQAWTCLQIQMPSCGWQWWPWWHWWHCSSSNESPPAQIHCSASCIGSMAPSAGTCWNNKSPGCRSIHCLHNRESRKQE